MNYRLSIIIPVYKTEKLIEKCLISVCEQTLENFEIIIIDDCSPDDSLDKAKLILSNYPERVKCTQIVKLTENHGISFVRKYGLNCANGEYIASLDSDDYLELNALEEMLSSVERNNADIGFFNYYSDIGTKKKIINQNVIDCSKESIIKKLFLNELHGSLCNKIFRKEILEKVNYVADMNVMEDFFITIQSVFYSNKICYENQAFLHYVSHNYGSYTSNYNFHTIGDMINCIDYLESFLKKNGYYNELKPYINYRKCLIKADAYLNLPNSHLSKFYDLYSEAENNLDNVKKLPLFQKKLIMFRKNLYIISLLKFIRNSIKFLGSKT